jgi:hypothetical protein
MLHGKFFLVLFPGTPSLFSRDGVPGESIHNQYFKSYFLKLREMESLETPGKGRE